MSAPEVNTPEYWDAREAAGWTVVDVAEISTDTTVVDNQQLSAIFAHLQATQAAEQRDTEWAGPSLPHPTEATRDEEHAELTEGWDNWQRGLEPNQGDETSL